MHEGLTSTTATIVACARGAAGVDPIAARFLPPGFAQVARAGEKGFSRFIPFVDLMRVRTLAIDEGVTKAALDGCTQLVVLGAGLCARAWRMESLADTIVYEVDHPSTQRYKRRRLEGLKPCARDVKLVGVDFEHDDLVTRLEEAGHDAHARTTWIWEGVTPYLTPPAIASTLAAVRRCSANGSTLLMTYGTPPNERTSSGRLELLGGLRQLPKPAGDLSRRVLHWLAHPVLRVIGEPLEGLISVKAIHELTESKGFAIKEDVTYMEIAARMSLRAPLAIVAERLLTAVAT